MNWTKEEDIDWGKAPKWATHYIIDKSVAHFSGFHHLTDGIYYECDGVDGRHYHGDEGERITIISIPNKRSHYWDGKEDLDVGMVVTTDADGESEFKVKFRYGQQIVIANPQQIIFIYHKNELKSLIKDPKVLFQAEMLKAWRGQHLDLAHDNAADITELAALCYEKLDPEVIKLTILSDVITLLESYGSGVHIDDGLYDDILDTINNFKVGE